MHNTVLIDRGIAEHMHSLDWRADCLAEEEPSFAPLLSGPSEGQRIDPRQKHTSQNFPFLLFLHIISKVIFRIILMTVLQTTINFMLLILRVYVLVQQVYSYT